MNALVVGAGEIGRWVGDVLRTDVFGDVTLAFADADPTVAKAAARSLDAQIQSVPGDDPVDLVCIAVPIPAATGAIETWSAAAGSAIVDVTGTMADPVDAMQTHAPGRERASFHPLFAPGNEPGNVAIVVDEGGPFTDRVREALAARGNELYDTTARAHDEAMETVQAKTHTAVLAYALAAESVPPEFNTPISAELAELAGQVTDGDPSVYSDIQATFDGAEAVADAARRLADADPSGFEELYEDAGE
jgi:prephenate dehydrogenase